MAVDTSRKASSQATAMRGIAKIYLGDREDGLELLRTGLDLAPEDPHRFRHLRELAIGLLLQGDVTEAMAVSDKLAHLAPDLLRNEVVAVPILWLSGRHDEAKRRMDTLLSKHPTLCQATIRLNAIRDNDLARRLTDALLSAGLPP